MCPRPFARVLAGPLYTLGWLVLGSQFVACGARSGLDVDVNVEPSSDGAVIEPVEGCVTTRRDLLPDDRPAVDVLFVVDSSGSMMEEQRALGDAFPVMARALVEGDLDADGELDFPPIDDLHVAVVTGDLGLLIESGDGLEPFACTDPASPRGDDGLLRNSSTAPGCSMTPGAHYLSHREGRPVEALERDLACLARVGTDGCGYEQPLESALKALSPSDAGLTFASGGTGHGDGLNDGFLRPGSLLAIVILTDEDDQSFANLDFVYAETVEEAFETTPRSYTPVERYVDGLRALRDDPERLVVSAIAGVPPDLAASAGEIVDYEHILADPRMQRRFDEAEEGVWSVPSCDVEGVGRAYPPRRIVELARAFGDRATVQSICQTDYRSALQVITARMGEVIRRVWCEEGARR